VIKKTFILLPLVLLLTACSNKNLTLDEDRVKEKSSFTTSTLSYNDYKSAYESKNQKLKNRPNSKYEPMLSKEEYEKLSFTDELKNINSSDSVIKRQSFIDFYSDWKNVRYKMGGTSRTGIDCSGFTQKLFKEKFGIELPRTTLTQVNVGVEVKKSDLKMGDLVFFKTSKVNKHVGIYMGNGDFLHSSVKGIQFTKLDKPFYKDSYWTARRIIN